MGAFKSKVGRVFWFWGGWLLEGAVVEVIKSLYFLLCDREVPTVELTAGERMERLKLR